MMNRQQETRTLTPIVSPRKKVRIGSLIHVGSDNLLEVKQDKKMDFVTTIEMVELMEGRKVKEIIYQDNSDVTSNAI